MGHKRLGTLPSTQRWGALVSLVAGGANVQQVAAATLHAAHKGLELAADDAGVAHVLWLLTRTVLAAKDEDFPNALSFGGIDCGPDPSVYDVVGAFSDAVDDYFLGVEKSRSDFAEMAQNAAAESLAYLLTDRGQRRLGIAEVETQLALKRLSTQKGFAGLAHDFYARFSQRFLAYHLSRELSLHCGGNGRFRNSAEHSDFLRKIDTLCHEAAAIVREFAGAWYSKSNFQGGISERKARGFSARALHKINAELAIRGRQQ